ncbi:MAG: hypothetical protein ACLTNW_02930 [Mediterraneibacter gnavus]
MKKFNWDEFKNKDNKIAVNCKTEEEAKDFCRQMHGQRMKWRNGESYLKNTNYDMHNEGTCYYGDGEWSSLDIAKNYNYKILEWSDYMQKEFTKSDLKDGMVVEYRRKDYGKRMVVGNMLIGEEGSHRLEAYENDLTQGYAESQLSIIRVYKIKNERNFKHIMHDDNLELIWERKKLKKMTVEEMRKKLEELTGEEIEVVQE